MSEIPSHLKYTESHEWLNVKDDGSVVVGITDHAQHLLGDLVYIELPEVGETVASGEDCAVVESVKAASDVFSPIEGEIIEVNEALNDSPSLVNSDPYGEGWLFRIQPTDMDEVEQLLDSDTYAEQIADEENEEE